MHFLDEDIYETVKNYLPKLKNSKTIPLVGKKITPQTIEKFFRA